MFLYLTIAITLVNGSVGILYVGSIHLSDDVWDSCWIVLLVTANDHYTLYLLSCYTSFHSQIALVQTTSQILQGKTGKLTATKKLPFKV